MTLPTIGAVIVSMESRGINPENEHHDTKRHVTTQQPSGEPNAQGPKPFLELVGPRTAERKAVLYVFLEAVMCSAACPDLTLREGETGSFFSCPPPGQCRSSRPLSADQNHLRGSYGAKRPRAHGFHGGSGPNPPLATFIPSDAAVCLHALPITVCSSPLNSPI